MQKNVNYQISTSRGKQKNINSRQYAKHYQENCENQKHLLSDL